MCARYQLTSPAEAVRDYFGHAPAEPFPPRYNIAPTQPVHIVRRSAASTRELVLVRWGLIPSWVKKLAEFSTLINARAETAAEKPSFRTAMRHKRCLVPATGFYEWTGAKGRRRPMLIRPIDRGPMAFAGLYEHWHGADGSELETMAILTVPSNRLIASIHDRMPAILPPEMFDRWLDDLHLKPRDAGPMLQPAPEDLLDVTEIDPKINNSRAEGPEAVQPVAQQLL